MSAFEDTSGRAKVLFALLVCNLPVDAACVLALAPHVGWNGPVIGLVSALGLGWIGWHLILTLATGAAFVWWTKSAYRNLDVFGVEGLQRSWRPDQAVRELWQASDPEQDDATSWKTSSSSSLIGIWGLAGLLGNCGFRLRISGDSVLAPQAAKAIDELMRPIYALLLVRFVLHALAVVLTFLVVRAIINRQWACQRKLNDRPESIDIPLSELIG